MPQEMHSKTEIACDKQSPIVRLFAMNHVLVKEATPRTIFRLIPYRP
jgi:hypothetical protein